MKMQLESNQNIIIAVLFWWPLGHYVNMPMQFLFYFFQVIHNVNFQQKCFNYLPAAPNIDFRYSFDLPRSGGS